MDDEKDKFNLGTVIAYTLFGIVFFAGVTFYVYQLVHCWNIPIAAREGICAMLHS